MAEPLQVLSAHRRHSRSFRDNRFVYPVLSRRAKGMSIGVNLNPDKICNFDCIYCQVDRRSDAETKFVEVEQLFSELTETFELIRSDGLFDDPDFREVPATFRRINDIAFSGDGEPTTFRNFAEIVRRAIAFRDAHDPAVKLVVLTNATMFDRPAVADALEFLANSNGEIWAKLDAGTSDYYQLVERTPIPFEKVLSNLECMARRAPLVIQSLFMRIHDQPPSDAEIEAYVDRLATIVEKRGQLKLVQVYTVARPPAESYVTALSTTELDAIVAAVQRRIRVPVDRFG